MKCCCCNGGLIGLAMSAAIVGASVIVTVATSSGVEIIRTARAAVEDPITGDWEGTASGDAFPEDLQLTVSLEMDEEFAVTGSFATLDGEAPFEGDFDAENNTLTGVVTSDEYGTWDLTLTLEEDELSGEATEENSGSKATVSLERTEDD